MLAAMLTYVLQVHNALADEEAPTSPEIAILDAKIAEVDEALRQANGDKRALKQRREDFLRLKRVELIYVRGCFGKCTLSKLIVRSFRRPSFRQWAIPCSSC